MSSQAAEPYQEYRKHIESAQTITALTDDLMGDSVSLYNGATEFNAVDIDLPGNNALPVQLRRRFSIELSPPSSPGGNAGDPNLRGIGDWDIDVPYISATYGPAVWESARCSNGYQPSVPAPLDVTDVWQGNTVHIPGAGDRKMLKLAWAQIPRPSDGVARKWTTRERDMFTCIPMQGGLAGEGFMMQTSSGLKYYFDRATTRNAGSMTYQPGPSFPSLSVGRTKYYLLASKIADRFGNTVNFTYNASGYPTSIVSSDGRSISLSYSGTHLASATVHDSVTGQDRAWSYGYGTGAESGMLTSVTLPDGSAWGYAHTGTLAPVSQGVWDGGGGRACGIKPPPLMASFGLTVAHPSGAVGAFQFGNSRHPRSGVHMSACLDRVISSVHTYKLVIPNYFDVMTLSQKTITGPGLSTLTWTYDYPSGSVALWGARGQSFTYPCTTCASSKTVTVHEPDGTTKLYDYGYLYGANEGRLLGTTTLDVDGVVRRVETTQYLPESVADSQNFYPLYGMGFGPDDPSTLAVRPVIKHVIQQDGTTFTMQVETGCIATGSYCFNEYGQPTSVTRFSSLGFSKDETTTYYNDTDLWVLGQVESSATNGIETMRTEFGWKALPWRLYEFGNLKSTFSYYTGGTPGSLSSVTDGNGNSTLLGGWKRGIPQTITFPATDDQPYSETRKAVVSDSGWITSINDENDSKTCYTYDAMGRLTGITYPSEAAANTCNTSTWAKTTQSFAFVTSAEYGIPAGHWKQTVSTGNGRQVTYFDALWRPLVVERYDNANAAATRSVMVTRYDEAGRPKFQSYPVASLSSYASTSLKGSKTVYDALGRVLTVEQDSELGVLTTTTAYQSGFKIKVTNPRNNATTTSFMAYDQPTTDWPVAIVHPGGAYTDIERDPFGKPMAITRRNSTGTVSLTRSYAYNANQELCRQVEPETGATVMGYDGAGNLAWSAAGVVSTIGCDPEGDHSAIAPRRVDRSYDARNRLLAVTFPDHKGDTAYAYTPDSKLASVTADNGGAAQVTTQYDYNRRGLLTGERMLWGSIDWSIGYVYNTNGHLSQHSYPGGLIVAYAPNALGQPTQAGAYASTVTYHPNGAIKSFTYGNNIARTLTQNTRGLPDRSRDVYGGTVFLDDGYDYDQNGNVAAISDGTSGHAGDRTMTYDALDRLTKTVAPGMFGTATYTYDVLDNLTRSKLTGGQIRDHYYCYDNNRLTEVSTGSCSGTPVMELDYDVQGNLKERHGLAFTFDYGNRLRSVSGSPASSYVYDGHGRRVRDYVGASKYSLYSSGGQLLFTSDQRNRLQSWPIYLGGSLLVAIRERNIDTGAVANKYQHTDALGSPVVVTSQGRGVLEKRKYEPYGSQVSPAPQDGQGYTGHVYDAATGMLYMQQRYYDPVIGRFLSVDPVTAHTSPGANFNRYWYANNSPYRFTDPDGRYGRGTGWKDPDWKKFDRAQQSAAKSLERASAKITKALETGKGLKGVTRSFERTFGKGTGTAENMSKVASTMTSMAGALRDDGSGGFMANAMTASEMMAAYPNQMTADTPAGVPSNNRSLMLVNINHPSLNSPSDMSWIVGHESAHGVGVVGHGIVDGDAAYRFGSPGERDAFKQLPEVDPAAALRNPDTLMDFAR